MKRNKFGKLQKLILRNMAASGRSGRSLEELHLVAFPGKEYTESFLIPILLRMIFQDLVKVNWNTKRAFIKEGNDVAKKIAVDSV